MYYRCPSGYRLSVQWSCHPQCGDERKNLYKHISLTLVWIYICILVKELLIAFMIFSLQVFARSMKNIWNDRIQTHHQLRMTSVSCSILWINLLTFPALCMLLLLSLCTCSYQGILGDLINWNCPVGLLSLHCGSGTCDFLAKILGVHTPPFFFPLLPQRTVLLSRFLTYS